MPTTKPLRVNFFSDGMKKEEDGIQQSEPTKIISKKEKKPGKHIIPSRNHMYDLRRPISKTRPLHYALLPNNEF